MRYNIMNTTSIMAATSAAITTAEATEKIGFGAKVKSFAKAHKTALIIGGTAAAGVAAGAGIATAATKVKANGVKATCSKLKKKAEKTNETQAETTSEEQDQVIDVEPTPATEETPAEKQEQEPAKEKCENCNEKSSA